MSNLATVTPIRPHVEVVESRVAELEDGYTRTANALLEAVMLSGLTQHHLLIVMAVWRKTYGYNKKMDWIGNEQFAALTGMAATKCSTAKNELIRMGVLTQVGRLIGMNTNLSEWKTKFNGIRKSFTESVKESFTESVKCTLPNQSNTKDNIQKKERQYKNTMPEQVQAMQEKAPSRHEETDKAFESIFWCAGMRKTGKKNAASAFRTQFALWRKETHGSPEEFARMLAEDIRCRAGVQFGFDRLHPATYLNGQRWNDEKPVTAAQQVKSSSAITVSKTGLVFWDR
ncbi:replication protein [Salmonella enterica]|uniref:Replication protein n=1 Tax=Salmonella enterica TaxID=28901 RepID=A0A745VWF7_SALER|nr:replication protein [Salmonella enterica]EBV6443459.1 replication protein [Salmonella enterica subsp. enterica serovar Havana]ECT0544924.1 replication protein [Salmonella enterica subsp. enterica serovar Mbandaka]EDC2323750.1 replication protein [Salmonella enterica]EDP9804831.1 replication protein [Salmonella enterica subsp. enterica serovar Mbandaka]EDT9061145.1 replication protein [Salmonella enterica subsp. enterica serovar Mbandaka]